jgi:hypothetical protein
MSILRAPVSLSFFNLRMPNRCKSQKRENKTKKMILTHP